MFKRVLNIILRNIILMLIFGCIYTNIELVMRNYTDIRMLFVGGLCGLCIGLINEFKPKMPLYLQSIISTIIVLIIEFVSGYYFNIIQGLNIWDYSDKPFNIMGQICLPYAFLWFLLSIVCIYVDDFLRHQFFNKEEPEKFIDYLKRLLSGK